MDEEYPLDETLCVEVENLRITDKIKIVFIGDDEIGYVDIYLDDYFSSKLLGDLYAIFNVINDEEDIIGTISI